jgi:hypothetical protein
MACLLQAGHEFVCDLISCTHKANVLPQCNACDTWKPENTSRNEAYT